MSEINKSYRINTKVGTDLDTKYITIDANLVQDYDTFDILSVKIDSVDAYNLHNANYGVVVGRVLANNGFGIPNAKLSIFISSDGEDGEKVKELYPFTSSTSKDGNGVRYNLLPNEQVSDCHQIVGTFPNKRFALDNDVVLEVFDKYYKYTTRTNGAGDYLIMGVPVGNHTLHMDLDLSDCGILSQRPRDFVYKGYTIEQFENPNMFKNGTAYSNLSQVFTQDQMVNVQPFWGNSSLGEKIGITRADIDVAFKFEPTCVFMGSVISDNSSQGISKKCIPTENMGNMEELTTGEGTIEMIRKTPGGDVEEFQVKGTQLIDGNGVWCYQIPMNLDYMMTDEYGNMVPTDDPQKGIPTRARVRFRVSMQDNEENVDNYFRAKVLVPHNPQNLENGKYEKYDYEFGSLTREDSFRDLFWNNVYSVKSYIPRFQKRKVGGWKEKKFTGIKNCNFYGSNNPMPYNNIRIKLPFMFTVMCALLKIFIFIIGIINTMISMVGNMLSDIGNTFIGFTVLGVDIGFYPFPDIYKRSTELSMSVLKEGLCPDLENWYFAPMFNDNLWSPPDRVPDGCEPYDLLSQTLKKLYQSSNDDDPQSIDVQNDEEKDGEQEEPICLTVHTDYLIACIEMNLAMEYRVINFDFYNDWVNGTLYFPRFMRYIRPKKTFLGITFAKTKVKGCMDDTSIFSKTRRYTQQCSIGVKNVSIKDRGVFTGVDKPANKPRLIKSANNLHKQRGLTQKSIFGKNGGICHEHSTLRGQYVYYMKPCEWTYGTSPNNRKVTLFATDIILLGSLNECDMNGIPQAFKYLSSTSYVMPTNLALTNMETNGWLFAGKGTICSGSHSMAQNPLKNKVEVVSPNNGLTAEIEAYRSAQDPNYNTDYDGDEFSDTIAMTEAAGIAWNYTGPGQGEITPAQMYYPGGHFLGLSCVNSQTNIKSCINLSRICEVGANMSQRKEDVYGYKDGKLKYAYTVPTGFISGDDIVGENFRTMFASMNYKRLLATKTNPVNGYKMYDFNFLKPINFDGTFKNVVNGSSLYNGRVSVPKENDNIFKKIGIALGINRDDYDKEESANTQTRTIEDTSIDYYMFRFGLTYEELRKTDQKHLRRFLVTDGNHMYLPQYENSYYFYFGLKNGATAIDEFNKQFFSECENGKLIAGQPIINISALDGLNICNGTADITVSTVNMETPYRYIEYYSDIEPTPVIITENTEGTGDEKSFLNSYFFTLKNKKFGKYTVVIRDANDIEYTAKASIGTDLVSYNITIYDFNTTSGFTIDDPTFKGGYVEISNIKIDATDDEATISLVLKEGENIVNSVSGVTCNSNNDYIYKVEIPSANTLYTLYAGYDCDGSGSDFKQQYFYMQDVIVKDGSSIGLFMGSKFGSKSALTISDHGVKTKWWNSGTNYSWLEKVGTFYKINPANYGVETFSSRVFAINGTKVVWGCPQSSEKVDINNVGCSEIPETWGNGFMVDDEYSYYPTLNYINNSAITHYSALAYNGNVVMGNPSAYLDSAGTIHFINRNDFGIGYGYIFKPLPDGDLQFHIYNGELTYDNVDGTITKGLFYPSVVYPVVNRPFYGDFKFYVWQNRHIALSTDESGKQVPNITDYTMSGRVESVIYNGITNKGMFGEDSYISFYNGQIKTPKGKEDDFYGVSNNINRESVFNYTYNATEPYTNNFVNFLVKEYSNSDEDANLVGELNGSISLNFNNHINYSEENDGIITINEEDGYYVCLQPKGENFLQQSKDKYVYLKRTNTSYTVAAVFTDKATYDVKGSVVMIELTYNGRAAVYKYKETASNGTVSLKEGGVSGDTILNVIENMFDRNPQIEGMVKYEINPSFKGNDWSAVLEQHKKNWEERRIKRIDEGEILYAYGVIENNGINAKAYKIYPNLVKETKFEEQKIPSISIDPQKLRFYQDGGTKKVTVYAIDDLGWIAEITGDWITVNPQSGVSKTTTIEVTVGNLPNNITSREGKVTFNFLDDVVTLSVVQKPVD